MLLSSNQLSQISKDRFFARCETILCENYPDQIPLDFDLPDFVCVKDQEAMDEKLRSELQRFRYIHAAFILGAAFPNRIPVMRSILDRKDIACAERAFLVEKTMISMIDSIDSKKTIRQ
jgi:hypothetical protein